MLYSYICEKLYNFLSKIYIIKLRNSSLYKARISIYLFYNEYQYIKCIKYQVQFSYRSSKS